MTEVNIYTERVDDIPLLMHLQSQMGIPAVLNRVITPHGNRRGLSIGALIMTWLTYLLSHADHRMSEVEEWAATHLETLTALIPDEVTIKDFTDDRLADALRLLSDDQTWEAIETDLGRQLVNVYSLNSQVVRLDSTAAAIYHDTAGTTLFRHGHSKDHRPDLAQFKVMLASLDPLGMPLATLVVAGNHADDSLYLPAVERARQVVGRGGKLYVGDSKMGALPTRATIARDGDFYLMPLQQTGTRRAVLPQLLAPVWSKQQRLESIRRAETSGDQRTSQVVALGYEAPRPQHALIDGQLVEWQERVLVIYSPSLAVAKRRGLHEHLERCVQELIELTPPRGRGRRQWEEQAALEQAVRRVVTRHGVAGLLAIRIEPEVEVTAVRRYGACPARRSERVRLVVAVTRQAEAIRLARRQLGWRLYVTNAAAAALPLAEAVRVYRGAPRIERNFHRLKGRPLGLRPVYVQREDHATGLVRLLTLALRVLTVGEFVVREKLGVAQTTLRGLYAGNPQRETAHPTTERLLAAMKQITLTVVRLPDRVIGHITPLSDVQKQILGLLGLSASIYDEIVADVQPIPP